MIEWSIRRPVTVLMICLALIVLGLISFSRIPLQLLPDFELPILTVTTQMRGATATEVDSQLTDPIERALSTLPHLREMRSISEKERSEVRLEFSQGTNLKELIPQIKDRLDMAGAPDTASRPVIQFTSSNRGPILTYVLNLKGTGRPLAQVVRELNQTTIRELERVDGVAFAQAIGAPQFAIEIELSREALLARGIPLQSVIDSLIERQRWIPLGEVREGEQSLSLRFGQPLKALPDLLDVTVSKADGTQIRLGEIATIQRLERRPEAGVSFNANDAVLLEVYRESDANSVEVAKAARQTAAASLAQHPDVNARLLVDQGSEIEGAIEHVVHTVVSGGVLASVVIYVLIQIFWSSMVVSLTIPLSLLMTLILMNLFGVSFNLMSLSGLALGVGMLVDNSTVVLGSIETARRQLSNPIEAAVHGAKRVAGAVTGSTLSTLAVFAPLIFIKGSIGIYFRDVAKTISFAMLSSLYVSLVVIPLLAVRSPSTLDLPTPWNLTALRLPILGSAKYARFPSLYFALNQWLFMNAAAFAKWLMAASLARSQAWLLRQQARFLAPVLELVSVQFQKIEDRLGHAIAGTFEQPRRTFWIAIATTLFGLALIASKGTELFPDESVDRIEYRLEAESTLNADAVRARFDAIATRLKELKEQRGVLLVRGAGGGSRAKIVIFCEARDLESLNRGSRKIFAAYHGISSERVPQSLVTQGAPIVVELSHDSLSQLLGKSRELESFMAKLPYLSDVQNLQRPPLSEYRIAINPQRAAFYQADLGYFARVARDGLSNRQIGIFDLDGDSIPVFVKAQSKVFPDLDSILAISSEGEEQRRTYLREVSEGRVISAPSIVTRRDRRQIISIQAFLNNTSLGEAAARLERDLAPLLKDGKFAMKISGQNEDRQSNLTQLAIAFGLSIAIIFLLLASQFESLRQPTIILFAVPFCSTGVGLALWFFGLNLSATVMVGFILLVGAAVNTSIVIVDLANHLRAEGRPMKEAVVTATKQRFRPILVVTASNILGHVPMLFTGSEPGGSMQLPLAATLIGGLMSSTLLTLIIVPIVYVRITGSESVRSGEHSGA